MGGCFEPRLLNGIRTGLRKENREIAWPPNTRGPSGISDFIWPRFLGECGFQKNARGRCRDRRSLVRLRVNKKGEQHHAMEFLTVFWASRTIMLGLFKIMSWKRRGGRCENTRREGHGWKHYHTRTPPQKKRRTVLHRFELRPLNIYFLIRIYPTCKPLHHRARRWQSLLLLPHDCVPSRADKP
jgi:hypothetical protein